MSSLKKNASMTQAALEYQRKGFAVVPLCWPTPKGGCGCGRKHDKKEIGKAPLVPWKSAHPTRADVEKWWDQWPRANIGLLLSMSNLLVVDLDGPAAVREAKKNRLPESPSVRTARGSHHYFQRPEAVTKAHTKTGDSRSIDLLTKLAVVPPSVHRSGTRYAWKRELLSASDPAAAPSWVESLATAGKRASQGIPKRLPKVDVDGLPIPSKVREVILSGNRERTYASRSEAVFAVVAALVQAGCSNSQILAVLLNPDHEIGKKPREKGFDWSIAEVERIRLKVASSAAREYEQTDEGIVWRRRGEPIRVTNFGARIVSQVLRDDGIERFRNLTIEARLPSKAPRVFIVPASRFAKLDWVMEHLGPSARVFPGPGRHCVPDAIQAASGSVKTTRIFTHLGWTKRTRGWVYMHAAGGIGATGTSSSARVDLLDSLAGFSLPQPPSRRALREAIRKSLAVLEVAPHRLTVPLLAAAYRAPLGGVDFSIFAEGRTGAGKTAVCALVQQHFGSGLDPKRLPASWSSTANALEALAFTAKDALLVVDDFCPAGGPTDIHRAHRDADRLLRGQGNNSGRQRMRADSSLRPPKVPRGLLVATGEDVPRGTSLRARLLILSFGPADVNWKKLSVAQSAAAEGAFARAMAGYLRWLAGAFDRIQAETPTLLRTLRDKAHSSGQHRRTPQMAASLFLGWHYFLNFAREVRAIDQQQHGEMMELGWKAIGEVAALQAAHQDHSDEAKRFISFVGTALRMGRAHLQSAKGRRPNHPDQWGWKRDSQGGWQPEGDRIGWVKNSDVYLDPGAAYTVAQALARTGGSEITISQNTLKKRLRDGRVLLSTEQHSRETLTVRKKLGGTSRNVLHLAANTILGT